MLAVLSKEKRENKRTFDCIIINAGTNSKQIISCTFMKKRRTDTTHINVPASWKPCESAVCFFTVTGQRGTCLTGKRQPVLQYYPADIPPAGTEHSKKVTASLFT